MDQFSKLFSIPWQILCRFLVCKSITSALKSNACKDRHISFILKDDQIPSFTSKWILYLQEYMQLVGDLVLLCNTFRMLVYPDITLSLTVINVAIPNVLFLQTLVEGIISRHKLKTLYSCTAYLHPSKR